MTVTPKRDPMPLGSHSPLGLPSLWPPRIHFLSPWICLPWTFHVNGIAQLCGLWGHLSISLSLYFLPAMFYSSYWLHLFPGTIFCAVISGVFFSQLHFWIIHRSCLITHTWFLCIELVATRKGFFSHGLDLSTKVRPSLDFSGDRLSCRNHEAFYWPFWSGVVLACLPRSLR